ncbi:MAG: hypothetical protein ABIZ36_09730 [Gemmatimonadaceae bacterium]
MTYRQLDKANILRTLERLKLRIAERFPGSGLSKVADELILIGNEISETLEYLKKPNYPIRIFVGLIIIVMLVFTGGAIRSMSFHVGSRADAIIPLFVNGIQQVVFLGVAVLFLLTTETRIKRKRALKTIHELRSVAHVVDMHQLTKDPEQISSPAPDTASSPERTMSPAELGRYLDYCSELLSVTSKLAALLVQNFTDEVILGAVNEIETLTTGLSSKIWQKIRLIEPTDRYTGRRTEETKASKIF